MSHPIIKVEHLSKQYKIGVDRTYKTLQDSITSAVKSPLNLFRSNNDSTFWALKDVSFDIEEGEVVGIIGRNGAGKSTLLKILSRITEPTEGKITMHGRVASLLEVGTGFHPELTGRENIYLNGSILGMKRREIDSKFDEIVKFAEIEKFLDTPVKRYSSGMYVRLAFAVAAHLEPEILIIDEVLAVGDAGFQKKCLGKMKDVSSKEGRTVLFVSHNMGVLREICEQGIWLDQGQVIHNGDIKDAIGRYLSSGQNDIGKVDLTQHSGRLPRMIPLLSQAILKDITDNPTTDFSQKDAIVLEVKYTAPPDMHVAGAGFILDTIDGVRVGSFATYMAYRPPHKLPFNSIIKFIIESEQLTPNRYTLTVSLGSHSSSLLDKVERVLTFTVHPADIYGTGYLLTREDGVVALHVRCKVDDILNV